jgi:hypothetical protein
MVSSLDGLSIVPALLGDGLRLFDNSGTETRWQLKNAVAYKTGVVELSYRLPIH